MCTGHDRDCPEFELHHQKLLDDLDAERRNFLKSAFVATGGVLTSQAIHAAPMPTAGQYGCPRTHSFGALGLPK